jgi:CheY-like chemotaxis protein
MEIPVMEGIAATVKIRELELPREERRHARIMGISANARPEQVAKMTEVYKLHPDMLASLCPNDPHGVQGDASSRGF